MCTPRWWNDITPLRQQLAKGALAELVWAQKNVLHKPIWIGYQR
jgi:hypothetical protein